MDFLNPKKKRSHKIRLFIGYALMAVALGIGTLILVFTAYGYDINRHTGDIIQNGLIVVDAHPESARILINGVDKGQTSDRLVLPAGNYSVQLHRDGYRDWQHPVNLEGSSIEQLVYPFLFPQKLVTKTLQHYDASPSFSSESPDRHWLIVGSSATPGSFEQVDLNDKKNPITTITLPADSFTTTTGTQTWEAVEWSTDNIHVLLKHTLPDHTEFIVLDRDTPASSINLTKTFSTQVFTAASLRDKKPDQFYLYNAADQTLLTADSKAKTTTPLLTHVLNYKSYQADTLLYVSAPAKDAVTADVHLRQSDQDYVLRTVPVAPIYLLEIAQFSGHLYVTAGSSADGHVYIYKDPFDDLGQKPSLTPEPFRVLIVPGAQYVSFSAIARFIAVQNGSVFAVYDAETGRQFKYDTKLVPPTDEKATWMDGHRLTLVSENKIHIFDFDGTNAQTLSDSSLSYAPFFDRDYTALFSIAPVTTDQNKATLLRTELKVLPPGQSQ